MSNSAVRGLRFKDHRVEGCEVGRPWCELDKRLAKHVDRLFGVLRGQQVVLQLVAEADNCAQQALLRSSAVEQYQQQQGRL